MGQRTVLPACGRRSHPGECVAGRSPQLSIFLTDFGWFGLLGSGQKIAGLTIGHVSSDKVREALRLWQPADQDVEPPTERDWLPDVRVRLQRYTQGPLVDFADCQVDLPRRTSFQCRVIAATRTIGYGRTITYGRLAEQVGAPRAARAVGSVMAANTVPIIIPCHRVVAAAGKLGGFSAPQGISLKERMLAMEAEQLASPIRPLLSPANNPKKQMNPAAKSRPGTAPDHPGGRCPARSRFLRAGNIEDRG